MAKDKRLFKVLKDGLTIGYTVCMNKDLVVNAHHDNCVDVLLENDGVHEKHGKVIEEVPWGTEPEEGGRVIGNIYGGKRPVPKKQEAEELGMVDEDGMPAEKKSAKKKTAAKKKTGRR